MDKTLAIGIVLLFITAAATAGFFLLTKNQPNENLIGGQTDEHGCLVAAGYSWDKEVQACIREWELNENQKKAAKIAVEYVNSIKEMTIKSVDVARCPGCFVVNLIPGLNSGGREVSVTLENWQVKIDSFEACEKAGNPIMESYPRQCTANGRTFVEKIKNNETGNEGGHVCSAEEKAAEACTMIYSPVCGDDGITYGNGCSACAGGKINRYVPGECTITKECGTCPAFMPPAPGWCENGVIISGQKDECGCQAPPKCTAKAIASDPAQAIVAQRPEFKDYPGNNFPPKSIISEAGGDNGWYIAFVQEGSGRPVISAACFFVDKNGDILSEKHYFPTAGEVLTAKFSAKTCSP